MYLLDTNVISETRRPARMHRNVRACRLLIASEQGTVDFV